MNKITVKELQLKIEKYEKDGKTKYRYIKAGIGFISETGTLTGISLQPYTLALLQDEAIKTMNIYNGQISLNVFNDEAKQVEQKQQSQELNSDIPF